MACTYIHVEPVKEVLLEALSSNVKKWLWVSKIVRKFSDKYMHWHFV